MVSIIILIRKRKGCFLDLGKDPAGKAGLEWDLFTTMTRTSPMFPEYRDLISQLKTSDHHFAHLFDKHNDLDQRIKNMESRIEVAGHAEIEAAKKEKLVLKDQLYAILCKASATA
jgi:uncharacterized protein